MGVSACTTRKTPPFDRLRQINGCIKRKWIALNTTHTGRGKHRAAAAIGLAVCLGVATGGVAIVAIGFVGAGLGAYGGSKGEDAFGESVGEKLYELKKEYL